MITATCFSISPLPPVGLTRSQSVRSFTHKLNKKICFCTIVEKSHKKLHFPISPFLANLSLNPTHATKTNRYSISLCLVTTHCTVFLVGNRNGSDERRHPEHNTLIYGRSTLSARRNLTINSSRFDGTPSAKKLGSMAMD